MKNKIFQSAQRTCAEMGKHMKQIERKINSLPSKTWYWLNLNEAVLTWNAEGSKNSVTLEPSVDEPMFLTVTGEDYAEKEIRIETEPGTERVVCMSYQPGTHLETVTEVKVAKDAKVRLVQVLHTPQSAVLVNRIKGTVAENGRLELYQIFLGEGDTYTETLVDLAERQAGFDAQLGYLAQNRQVLDLNMVVNHYGEETVSNIRADGALRDEAQKTFRGTIDFKRGSAGADGAETETVLMLGEDVRNRTIPVILCSEETVSGSHGATIGQLDEETLFYLESRGIGREAAEDMMARAAIDRLAHLISEETAKNWIQTGLEEVL